jgi:hypothetical protein
LVLVVRKQQQPETVQTETTAFCRQLLLPLAVVVVLTPQLATVVQAAAVAVLQVLLQVA